MNNPEKCVTDEEQRILQEEYTHTHSLKRCPFCGGTPEIRRMTLNVPMGIPTYSVFCQECSVVMGAFFEESPLIKAWNTRSVSAYDN